MKLLSIKAHGFKSFADKLEILVGNGITGIVGPNGSGKSNVVDAVRWVLGESSLKELRGGDTMSDVIFQGSRSRDAQNHAWVSLTFDNSDHYLASELSEIEIKREVYKTGENEYYINNAKVRKKDITDLFLDSGSNPDSYSIIGQGKISEILKGRPIDRRTIIEEAAGVLKYKKRKEETIRKLDNTKNNLDKIDLVIKELEISIEPLREQAEIAKKYQEYKNDLEGIEIALLAHDIKDIHDEYDKDKEKLKSLQEELLNLDSKSNIDTSKLEKLKTKSLKLDEDIFKISDELVKLSDEIATLETKKQVIEERRKYNTDDQKLESNIILLKETEVSLKKDISLIEKQIKELSKKKNEKNEVVNKISSELKSESLKKETLTKEYEEKRRKEINVRNKIEVLNSTLEQDSKLPYAVKSVINNPRLKGIHGVLGNLIDMDSIHATAIEVALGYNANVIICDNETSAIKAIDYLKDQKLGRATFFPISVIKPRGIEEDVLKLAKETPGFIDVASNLIRNDSLYNNIVTNQLGNVLLVDNTDTMNKLGKKIGYRYRIITLDGEILHTGGSLTGGVNRSGSGIINLKFELEGLEKELSILETESINLEKYLKDVDDDLKILEDKYLTLKTEETVINESLSSKMLELDRENNKLNNIQEELTGTSNKLKNKDDKELDNVLNDYLKLSTKRDELTINLSSLKTDKNDLLSEIEEKELENKSKLSEYNKCANEIKDLEISINRMDIKLDNLLTRLSEEYELTYEKAIKDYVLDLDQDAARTKVNRLRRDIKELGEVNIGSINEYERVSTRYNYLFEQKQDLENAISDLSQVITELDTTMEEKFKETFDIVKLEFSKVFKKLFKGGSATLKLTDPSDLLNTGVDIDACPPGKSLKNISALSGGEMTLTAIALLFSILNIRTVPFCILDEVEAALDDANVDTFGNYLKDYEEKCQFIVITHKKRTMEYINTLYGITMQESGVSKLVSVRLEK